MAKGFTKPKVDILDDPLNVSVVSGGSTSNYAIVLDEASATVTYVGKATTGSSTGAAVWQVQKLDSTSGLVITWADGDALFNNVWDNRASLTYN